MIRLKTSTCRLVAVASLLLTVSSTADAFWLGGQGHYSLRGETRTKPGFRSDAGTYQAIEQYFRLEGEARLNDRSSMFLEFRLFDDPRAAYLGDNATSENCRPNNRDPEGPDPAGGDSYCQPNQQNTSRPDYEPYIPRVTKLYARYAFDFCILEAGRRGRDWGLGIFMDAGNDPFDTEVTLYDGVACHINVQKFQTLGFSFGYDKLAETGNYIDPAQHEGRRFGGNDSGDDIDQYFFQIEYDDRRANAGAGFTKQIGVYFANVISPKIEKGGAAGGLNTDIKYLDLYTGFFFGRLALRNEILFRMGKSADPHWQIYGGRKDSDGQPVTNKLESVAIAGDIEVTLSRSGAPIGPAEYAQGNLTRHVLFVDYAHAPGDPDGYRRDYSNTAIPADDREKISELTRDKKVNAVAFHRNYKPALLLFNGRPEVDQRRVDGAFDPARVTNANVVGLGYRYESTEYGNFAVKLVTAALSEEMPKVVKDFYKKYETEFPDRPVGYYGKSLGYELDLMYDYKVGKEITVGAAAAAALPGKAWKISDNRDASTNILLQSSISFNF